MDKGLAKDVADGLGIAVPAKPEYPMNHSFPADADPKNFQPIKKKSSIDSSSALSMENTVFDSIKTRQIAILVANGVNEASVASMLNGLEGQGAATKIIGPKLGVIKGKSGKMINIDQSFLHTSPVLFDAVFVPDGTALSKNKDAINFVNEMYVHCKPIAVNGDGENLLPSDATISSENGIILNGSSKEFINAIASHRFWEREIS